MEKRSMITDRMDRCYVCGRPNPQIHHIFYGTANRRLSDQDGFIVPLCAEHHTGDHGAHFNTILDRQLKQEAQMVWERDLENSREAFIKRYGRSYL